MGIALGLVINKSLHKPEVTITGYTEDGRVDYDTKEGKKIFRQDCEDVGIILPRRDDD